MLRFAALRPDDIEMKAANEPVTIADREAEAMSVGVVDPTARCAGHIYP